MNRALSRWGRKRPQTPARGSALFVTAALAVMVAAAGCEGDKPAAGGELSDNDLAVPADFADEAEKSITPANYKSELDSLEKEIESEK